MYLVNIVIDYSIGLVNIVIDYSMGLVNIVKGHIA